MKFLLGKSGMPLKVSGIPLTIGIRNPTSIDTESVIQYLRSGIHREESRMQNSLGFPCMRQTYASWAGPSLVFWVVCGLYIEWWSCAITWTQHWYLLLKKSVKIASKWSWNSPQLPLIFLKRDIISISNLPNDQLGTFLLLSTYLLWKKVLYNCIE